MMAKQCCMPLFSPLARPGHALLKNALLGTCPDLSTTEVESTQPLGILKFGAMIFRPAGRIYAAVVAKGREAGGARAVDLLIAATACAAELPLYTRNPDDFRGLEKLVHVVTV